MVSERANFPVVTGDFAEKVLQKNMNTSNQSSYHKSISRLYMALLHLHQFIYIVNHTILIHYSLVLI